MFDQLFMLLPSSLKKAFIDFVLDFVEDNVLGSKSKVDDAFVLPICDTIRAVYDVPDNDFDKGYQGE